MFGLKWLFGAGKVGKPAGGGAEGTNQGAANMSPIHLAAHSGKVALLDVALQHCDINTADNGGRTALHIAASLGHVEFVQALLALGAEVNGNAAGCEQSCGSTPLALAVISGHTTIEGILKEHGGTQEVPFRSLADEVMDEMNRESQS